MQISFQDVSKHYHKKGRRVTAVERLDWEARGERVYGILGPNGSGKTSMIRMLLDLIRPDLGEITVDGSSNGNRRREFRQSVGYLPEERGLYRKEKTLELLVYFARLKGVPKAAARERALISLERMQLEEYAHSPVQGLSKGMSQKVQLIATLLHDPKLVILDEPFTGLDPKNVKALRELIAERKSAGALVLLCTHRMFEAELLCDQVLMLNKGRMLLSGDLHELRRERGVRVSLQADIAVGAFESVESSRLQGRLQEVVLRPGRSVAEFLAELSRAEIAVHDLQVMPVPLEELYLRAVEDDAERGGL